MLEPDDVTAQIYHFLSAYSFQDIRKALRTYGLLKREHLQRHRAALQAHLDKSGWQLHNAEDIPEGHEWMEIAGKKYIRKPNREQPKQRRIKSTYTTSKTSVYHCPICSDKVYSYKLCTACDKAKAGLTFSNTCSSCSFTFFTDEDPSKREEDAL